MNISNFRTRSPNTMAATTTRTARLAGLIAALLLAAGCGLVPAPAVEAEPPAVVEPTAEPTPEEIRATVTQNANVRSGPGLGHAILFWLTAGTDITVRGRNIDGTWLWVEQAERAGWIFAALTNVGASTIPGLPEVAAPTPEPQVAVVPTATPVPEPTPEPEPVPEADEPAGFFLTVTGNPVNMRQGPGTDFPVAFQAAAGDRFEVTGRNANATWFQVADPRNPGERLWIYGP